MSRTPVSALLLLLLCACAPFRVRTEFDKGEAPQMHAWRTWAWYGTAPQEGAAAGGSGETGGPLLRGVLRSEVEAQLAKHGFQKAPEGQEPDFRVAWHGSISPELQVTQLGGAYPWGPWVDPWYVGGMGTTTVTSTEKGRLVLDMVDARTGTLTWRGTAEGPVDTGSIKFEQKVRTAVQELLERFPPGT